jgi:hypothetical protein
MENGYWTPAPLTGPTRFDDPAEPEEPAAAPDDPADHAPDAPGPCGWATPDGCPRF